MVIGRGPESVRECFLRQEGDGDAGVLASIRARQSSVHVGPVAYLLDPDGPELSGITNEEFYARLCVEDDDALNTAKAPRAKTDDPRARVPEWFEASDLVAPVFLER